VGDKPDTAAQMVVLLCALFLLALVAIAYASRK